MSLLDPESNPEYSLILVITIIAGIVLAVAILGLIEVLT
jgi:hypothetical protein